MRGYHTELVVLGVRIKKKPFKREAFLFDKSVFLCYTERIKCKWMNLFFFAYLKGCLKGE